MTRETSSGQLNNNYSEYNSKHGACQEIGHQQLFIAFIVQASCLPEVKFSGTSIRVNSGK
jgi:hypothetical protein